MTSPPQPEAAPVPRAAPWRVAVPVFAMEALAATSFLARGFPYFGSGLVPNAPWWELPLALVHLPAIELLTAMGLCCGFRNGLVLTHVIRGGHIPMTVAGTGILASTNLLCWLVLALLGRWLWARRSRSLPPPEAVA